MFPPNNNLQGWKMGAKSLVPEPVQFNYIAPTHLRVFDTEAEELVRKFNHTAPYEKGSTQF